MTTDWILSSIFTSRQAIMLCSKRLLFCQSDRVEWIRSKNCDKMHRLCDDLGLWIVLGPNRFRFGVSIKNIIANNSYVRFSKDFRNIFYHLCSDVCGRTTNFDMIGRPTNPIKKIVIRKTFRLGLRNGIEAKNEKNEKCRMNIIWKGWRANFHDNHVKRFRKVKLYSFRLCSSR